MNTRTNRLPVITLTVASLLGVGAAVGSASAGEPDQVASLKISYRDLDLSQPYDVQRLYQRLERAAVSVCGGVPTADLARYQSYQHCYQHALESAVLEIRSPELLALDRASRNGRPS